jgi:hypothetical protein
LRTLLCWLCMLAAFVVTAFIQILGLFKVKLHCKRVANDDPVFVWPDNPQLKLRASYLGALRKPTSCRLHSMCAAGRVTDIGAQKKHGVAQNLPRSREIAWDRFACMFVGQTPHLSHFNTSRYYHRAGPFLSSARHRRTPKPPSSYCWLQFETRT